MKKLLLAVVVLMLVGTVNAFATPVEFLMADIYDWGRVYTLSAGTWNPVNSNPYDGSAGVSIVAGSTGNGNVATHEDTFGVAQVDQIQTQPNPGTLLFDKDIPGSGELTVFFWGFSDDYLSTISPITGKVEIASIGGHAEIWYDPTPDYDPSLGTNGRNLPLDPTHYQAVTDDGIKVLDLIAVPVNQFNHTLIAGFSSNFFTGNGDVYFNVTGNGTWDNLYDTNGQLGGNADFFFQYAVEPNIGAQQQGNWIVRGAGRAVGDVVPEPTSMALLSLGLLGLVRLRRKS